MKREPTYRVFYRKTSRSLFVEFANGVRFTDLEVAKQTADVLSVTCLTSCVEADDGVTVYYGSPAAAARASQER